jgi:hypothetical protein
MAGAAATAVVQGLCTLIRRASSAALGEHPPAAPPSDAGRRASEAAAGGGGGLRGRLDPRTWSELHRGGADCPFRVRGPNYLQVCCRGAGGVWSSGARPQQRAPPAAPHTTARRPGSPAPRPG